MKPTENIEEFIRFEKPHVTTGDTIDKRTLNDSFAAMDETIRSSKKSIAGIILRSRAARLAAAAVIFIAISLLMVYQNPPVQQPPQEEIVAKSPAEMLTAMSLNLAWRRGGIEAMDEQSSKAFKMLGTKSADTTIEELHLELNGV